MRIRNRADMSSSPSMASATTTALSLSFPFEPYRSTFRLPATSSLVLMGCYMMAANTILVVVVLVGSK